jgi:hypothetical protein
VGSGREANARLLALVAYSGDDLLGGASTLLAVKDIGSSIGSEVSPRFKGQGVGALLGKFAGKRGLQRPDANFPSHGEELCQQHS